MIVTLYSYVKYYLTFMKGAKGILELPGHVFFQSDLPIPPLDRRVIFFLNNFSSGLSPAFNRGKIAQ
ncbi:hypothetical protein SAMN06298226_2127 [Nitrosovibrio sp. Nv4]|nr:hypothetical protein SAMN06298226_2127 [Nitrosovibrio sp. Nv4]